MATETDSGATRRGLRRPGLASRRIPLRLNDAELAARHGEDRKFVFHCASGWRSALSAAMLNDLGFEAAHLKDGFSGWAAAGGPVAFPDRK